MTKKKRWTWTARTILETIHDLAVAGALPGSYNQDCCCLQHAEEALKREGAAGVDLCDVGIGAHPNCAVGTVLGRSACAELASANDAELGGHGPTGHLASVAQRLLMEMKE